MWIAYIRNSEPLNWVEIALEFIALESITQWTGSVPTVWLITVGSASLFRSRQLDKNSHRRRPAETSWVLNHRGGLFSRGFLNLLFKKPVLAFSSPQWTSSSKRQTSSPTGLSTMRSSRRWWRCRPSITDVPSRLHTHLTRWFAEIPRRWN